MVTEQILLPANTPPAHCSDKFLPPPTHTPQADQNKLSPFLTVISPFGRDGLHSPHQSKPSGRINWPATETSLQLCELTSLPAQFPPQKASCRAQFSTASFLPSPPTCWTLCPQPKHWPLEKGSMSSASKILAPETSFRLSGRKEIIFQLPLTAPNLQNWKHRIAL